jgi:hypothetical protein
MRKVGKKITLKMKICICVKEIMVKKLPGDLFLP